MVSIYARKKKTSNCRTGSARRCDHFDTYLTYTVQSGQKSTTAGDMERQKTVGRQRKRRQMGQSKHLHILSSPSCNGNIRDIKAAKYRSSRPGLVAGRRLARRSVAKHADPELPTDGGAEKKMQIEEPARQAKKRKQVKTLHTLLFGVL